MGLSRSVEAEAAVVSLFFFQAEDGIRDLTVTGVQTCALPISIEQRYGVSRASADRLERVTALRAAPPAIARQAAVVAVAHGRLALWSSGAALRLPLEDGGGEEACRRAMRRVFGNVEGEVRLLGVVPAADRRPTIEVWLVRRLRRDLTAMPPGGLQWFAPQDIVARVGSPVLRDAVTLSALAVAPPPNPVPE